MPFVLMPIVFTRVQCADEKKEPSDAYIPKHIKPGAGLEKDKQENKQNAHNRQRVKRRFLFFVIFQHGRHLKSPAFVQSGHVTYRSRLPLKTKRRSNVNDDLLRADAQKQRM